MGCHRAKKTAKLRTLSVTASVPPPCGQLVQMVYLVYLEVNIQNINKQINRAFMMMVYNDLPSVVVVVAVEVVMLVVIVVVVDVDVVVVVVVVVLVVVVASGVMISLHNVNPPWIWSPYI